MPRCQKTKTYPLADDATLPKDEDMGLTDDDMRSKDDDSRSKDGSRLERDAVIIHGDAFRIVTAPHPSVEKRGGC
jgi:hypothetical protein